MTFRTNLPFLAVTLLACLLAPCAVDAESAAPITPLGAAIQEGDSTKALGLIKTGTYVKWEIQRNPDLLYEAVSGSNENCEEVVNALIEAGASPKGNPQEPNHSPVATAALTGKFKIARLLIEKNGADPNSLTSGTKKSPLMAPLTTLNAALYYQAAQNYTAHTLEPVGYRDEKISEESQEQHFGLLMTLIEKGVDLKTGQNQFCLIPAAIGGDVLFVKYLHENGAPVNVADGVERRFPLGQDQKMTPLLWAAKMGDNPTVEYLLKNGADARATDENGKTGLIHLAEMGGVSWAATPPLDVASIKVISPRAVSQSSDAMSFAEQEDSNSVEALARAGCPVNAKDKKGFTALLASTRAGNLVVMEGLLIAGANPNLQDPQGNTALMRLLQAKHRSVATDPMDKDLEKLAAKEKAAGSSPEKIAKVVEARRAKLRPIRAFVLKQAIKQDIAVIQEFAEHGVRLDIKNKSGKTVLQIAKDLNYPEVVKELVENGAK